jgi:hypothetical protein
MKPVATLLALLALAAMPAAAAPTPSRVVPVPAAEQSAPVWKPKAQGWAGLEAALTCEQALAVLKPKLGNPLIVNRIKGGRFEQWNYDNGGDLLFINGLLAYWTVPAADRDVLSPAEASRVADDKPAAPVPAEHGA